MLRARTAFLISLVFAAAASRVLPHPPDFTSVPALALFGGACLRPRWLAYAVPLAAMLLSGLLLYGLRTFELAVPVWLAIAGIVAIGHLVRRRADSITGGAVAASALFFAVTNLGVWLLTPLYPPTLAGLLACYAAALPFALNTLLGTLAYAFGMFGLLAFAERRWPVLAAEVAAPRAAP